MTKCTLRTAANPYVTKTWWHNFLDYVEYTESDKILNQIEIEESRDDITVKHLIKTFKVLDRDYNAIFEYYDDWEKLHENIYNGYVKFNTQEGFLLFKTRWM